MSEQFDSDYTSQDLSDPGYISQDPPIGNTGSQSYQQCQANLAALDPILGPQGWMLDCNSDPDDANKWNLVASLVQQQGPTDYSTCMANYAVLDGILEGNSDTAGNWYPNACCSNPNSDPNGDGVTYNLVIYPVQQ